MEMQTAEPCEQCGYDRRGTAADAGCPECGWHSASVVRDSSAERRWRWIVALGLVLLLIASLYAAQGSLVQRFRDGSTGSMPVLNLPAAKVWAVPLLQRSIGSRPANAGVSASLAALTVVLSVMLITTRPPGAQRRAWLRWWVRLGTPLLVGGAIGALLALPGVSWRRDTRDIYYVGLIGVELAATVPLYLYFGVIARRLGDASAGRWYWLALAAGGLIACAIGLVLLDEDRMARGGAVVLELNHALVGAAYGSAALIVGLLATAGVVGLLLRAVPIERQVFARMIRRGPQWLAERWRMDGRVLERVAVLLGITLLLWATWRGVFATLSMDRQGLGGSLPFMNFAGPKLWAVPLSTRYMHNGQLMALVSLVTFWLLTWRHTPAFADRPDRWAKVTRWSTVVVTSAFLGARNAAGRNYYGSGDMTEWAAAATVLAEAPVTLLLYLGTAAYATRIGATGLAKPLRIVGVAAVLLMAVAMIPLPLSKYYLYERSELRFIIPAGAYAAVSVGVGLYAATLWVRLGLHLLFEPVHEKAPARI